MPAALGGFGSREQVSDVRQRSRVGDVIG